MTRGPGPQDGSVLPVNCGIGATGVPNEQSRLVQDVVTAESRSRPRSGVRWFPDSTHPMPRLALKLAEDSNPSPAAGPPPG